MMLSSCFPQTVENTELGRNGSEQKEWRTLRGQSDYKPASVTNNILNDRLSCHPLREHGHDDNLFPSVTV